MTTTKNPTVEEILTTAASTVKLAAQALMDASKAMSEAVSIVSAKKQASTTTEPTSSESTVTIPKRKPGRPRKDQTIVTAQPKQDSTVQDLGTTSTTAKSEPKQPSTSSEVSSVVVKKRGANPEILAKARAAAAANRAAKKAKEDLVEAIMVAPLEPSKWPFPTSTVMNRDGTQKKPKVEFEPAPF